MAKNFLGFNDPYLSRLYRSSQVDMARDVISENENLLALKKSDIPSIRAVSFTDEYVVTATARWQQYMSNVELYRGDHFVNPMYDGVPKSVTNFCGMIVDKTTEWVVADGFKVLPIDGQSTGIAELLNDTWDENSRDYLFSSLVQESGIKGDSYIYVSIADKSEEGKPLARNDWQVKLNFIPAEFCLPIYRDDDPDIPAGVLISYPTTIRQEDGSEGQEVQFGMFATRTEIVLMQDTEIVSVVPNPLGEVPVVHFPHSPATGSKFGKSEINKISALNNRYNEVMTTLSKIIEYCGEPTTIVQGAKLVELQRGANKVWSNIPAEGKVYNLELKSELDPIQNFLDRIEMNIFRMAETPKIAFDTQDDGYSNTSGVAMQMLFQPLVEKTKRIRKGYTRGLQTVNRLILKCHERIIGTDIAKLYASERARRRPYATKIKYTSLLPKDKNEELDRVIKMLEAKLISRAEAIRQVVEVENPNQHAAELLADNAQKLIEAFEMQKAVQLIEPNLLGAATGSECLTESVEKILSSLK